MRRSICAAALACVASAAIADDVAAEPPGDLAVTIYRAPSRAAGSMDLNDLEGFALVSETRRVRLPQGLSRLRFEGVADGIEAASVIISGLPEGLIEKDRDAQVLSPAALVATALDKPVQLLRTNPKTGETVRLAGTILADAGGVVFKTADGVEALRCSGLPETFSFEPGTGTGPAARPSLSVLVRTPAPLTATITLAYLSRGFDWSADYSATLSADARFMDLGAWVTLANSNAAQFPSARTQVVAGRVNREHGTVEPFDPGGAILAGCWPRGSTSDTPPDLLQLANPDAMHAAPVAMLARGLQDVTLTASRSVVQEQLGDLKLYRVPERISVASRQSKQVRLLDRAAIPVAIAYRAPLQADDVRSSFAAERVLRSVNDRAHRLGLPLPSGRVAVFMLHDGQPLLLHEASLRDLAVDEKLELALGPSADVQVAVAHERIANDAARAQLAPPFPGAPPGRSRRRQLERVRISNASAAPVRVELPVLLDPGAQVIGADHPLRTQDGRPIFRLTVPARGSLTLQYRIQFESGSDPR